MGSLEELGTTWSMADGCKHELSFQIRTHSHFVVSILVVFESNTGISLPSRSRATTCLRSQLINTWSATRVLGRLAENNLARRSACLVILPVCPLFLVSSTFIEKGILIN